MKAKDKIYKSDDLKFQVQTWKNEGQKVVFTNGCFDILHLGHIDYLEKAREMGDRLIVGLNTDESVRRIKGNSRPIISEDSRIRVLASLMFVDAVVLFNEDTPFEIINILKPDVLIKGSDYTVDNIVGADSVIGNGGKVNTIDLVPGYSTSGIVEKIKNN